MITGIITKEWVFVGRVQALGWPGKYTARASNFRYGLVPMIINQGTVGCTRCELALVLPMCI